VQHEHHRPRIGTRPTDGLEAGQDTGVGHPVIMPGPGDVGLSTPATRAADP